MGSFLHRIEGARLIQPGQNFFDTPYPFPVLLDNVPQHRYIIESDRHSLRELTDLQNWVIIPRIKEISGVADVTNFGGITTQFQVEVDPHKLEQYNLSLAQVIEAIENNNANVGGSVLNRGDLGYVVRGIGLIENLDDLGVREADIYVPHFRQHSSSSVCLFWINIPTPSIDFAGSAHTHVGIPSYSDQPKLYDHQ